MQQLNPIDGIIMDGTLILICLWLKEFRKLQDSLPDGLKTVVNGRISSISNNLNDSNKLIGELKVKIRKHKKNSYTQQVDERKKW